MRRDPTIDLLRGLAIVMVMLLHFTLTYRLSASPLADLLGKPAVRALTTNGNYGVTAFFALSGYLITSNVLRRHGRLAAVDLRMFYVLRAARILPPLLLALAIIVPLGLAGLPSFDNGDGGKALPASFFVVAVASVLTFWHNVLMASVGYFNYSLNIYWSLSVEEVFYLAFPLLCVAARRTWPVVVACGCAIVVGPLYRHAHAGDELYFMYGYAACFDAIACGVLAALAQRWRPPALPLARALATGAAVALPTFYLSGIAGHEVFGFSGIAVATALFAYAAAGPAPGEDDWPRSGIALLAPLRWAGRHSYELYLFHIVVLGLMRDAVPREQLTGWGKLGWLVLFVALSALVAALVARFFAEPANAALRRRWGRPSGSLLEAPAPGGSGPGRCRPSAR